MCRLDLAAADNLEPSRLEQLLGIAVPTREEMQEIEVSSRLYVENGARYMTATLMCQSDTPAPKTTAVTFILSGHRLATVRYDDPRPFAIVEHRLARACPPKVSGESVLMDLLDAVIDRSADILERIGAEVDQISHSIFEPEEEVKPPSYNDVLKALGDAAGCTVYMSVPTVDEDAWRIPWRESAPACSCEMRYGRDEQCQPD